MERYARRCLGAWLLWRGRLRASVPL
jgi:hypothetical protein